MEILNILETILCIYISIIFIGITSYFMIAGIKDNK